MAYKKMMYQQTVLQILTVMVLEIILYYSFISSVPQAERPKGKKYYLEGIH